MFKVVINFTQVKFYRICKYCSRQKTWLDSQIYYFGFRWFDSYKISITFCLLSLRFRMEKLPRNAINKLIFFFGILSDYLVFFAYQKLLLDW